MKPKRDIEKIYSNDEFVAKLRRLADCIESGEQFEIQIAGERIYTPVRIRVKLRGFPFSYWLFRFHTA